MFQKTFTSGSEQTAGDDEPLPRTATAQTPGLPAEEEREETCPIDRPQDLQSWKRKSDTCVNYVWMFTGCLKRSCLYYSVWTCGNRAAVSSPSHRILM